MIFDCCMLKILQSHYQAFRRHGEETYPHECCGVLLGRFEDNGTRVVTSTVRCGNTRTDSAHNRFESSAKGENAGKISSASTTLIPTIQRNGRGPILSKRTGSGAPM